MQTIVLALVPGILWTVVDSRAAVLEPWVAALLCAYVAETVGLQWRGAPWRRHLGDGSAAVTATVFAFSLPTTAPWWLAAFGMLVGIGIGKQCFGGLGRNPFNPAMLGLAASLLAFPGLFEAPAESASAGWLSAAWCLGGVFLLWRGLIRWQAPLAALVTLLAAGGAAALGLPTDQATIQQLSALPMLMLAMWFIVTEPVSGCTTDIGRLAFGVLFTALTLAMLANGAPPASMAFAVLSMNVIAPWLDQAGERRCR